MTEQKKELELKAYFFVPYNISPIQQGIQTKHAFDEFLLTYGRNNSKHIVWDYMEKHKTVIILNGGTTNNRYEFGTGIPVGTLNQIVEQLQQNAVEYGWFQEPDLNDALTAICFIADERVWNYEDYPNLVDYICDRLVKDRKNDISDKVRISLMPEIQIMKDYFDYHYEWGKMMGGEKNIFLRELIRGKKLA